MKFSSKMLVAALFIYSAVAFAQNNADTIFYGGTIVTVNALNEELEALAIKDGKIIATGTKSEVTKGWQASSTKMINLQGKTVMPGLIDPHIHIILTAVGEFIWLDLLSENIFPSESDVPLVVAIQNGLYRRLSLFA
jgi:cytosine/adenosine deaminase-related metal-dependent hydrolase